MLDAVPRPRVRILNVNDINAYVAPMTICYDNIGVRWVEGASGSLTPGRGAVYQDGALSDPSGPLGQLLCRHTKASSNDIVTWLSRINTTDRHCKLKLKRLADDAFEITPGSGCNIEPNLRFMSGVSTFVVTPTIQNVTVFAGILRLLSEEQTIAVLYHELGHYYHGHANAPTGRYNYLYHLEATNPSTAPQCASDLAQVNADLEQAQDDSIKATGSLAFAKQSIPTAIYQDISGQRYHTALVVAIKRLVESSREPTCTTRSTCSHGDQASQIADAKLNRFALAEVGITGPLSDDERKGYLEFENEAAACLDAKAIVANDLTPFNPGIRSHVLTPPSILQLLQDASFGLTLPHIGDIEPQGNLGTYLNQITSRLKDKYPKFNSTSLSLLPSSLSRHQSQLGQLAVARQRLEGFEQRAQRDHLGYYTVEEEADDLAIEWGYPWPASIPPPSPSPTSNY